MAAPVAPVPVVLRVVGDTAPVGAVEADGGDAGTVATRTASASR